MAVKPFSKEDLNFLKFASIVFDEFTEILRLTFVDLWNSKIAPLPGNLEWNDSPAVRNLLSTSEGSKTEIPVNDSLKEWDCTVLFKATIYSKTFPSIRISSTTKKPRPLNFHSSLKSPTGNKDETIALAIDQMRRLRNTLCHLPNSSITKTDFDKYVRLAKEAFDTLGFPKRRIDEIGGLEEEDFPIEKVNELNKKILVIQESYELQKTLEKKIDTLTELQQENMKLLQKVVKIEENTDEIDRRGQKSQEDLDDYSDSEYGDPEVAGDTEDTGEEKKFVNLSMEDLRKIKEELEKEKKHPAKTDLQKKKLTELIDTLSSEKSIQLAGNQENTVFQRIRQHLKSKMPEKSIDDVEDVMEMGEIFKLLKIEYDRKNMNLEEMKKKAKAVLEEQSSGSGKYSKGTTGFAVIAKAKDDDMLKREKLRKLYFEVMHDCLLKLDDRAASEVNSEHYPGIGVFSSLREQINLLRKTDYHILIAGESSSGKSSLLNLILGEEVLPHHVSNTTSTVCELKFGKKRKLVVHYKYDDDQKYKAKPRTFDLKTKKKCGKSYQAQINSFVNVDQGKQRRGSNYEKIEIFWPHELLEEGVVFIDTPGLGESDEMDKVLLNYLPMGFALIYVIDVSQRDMTRKLKEIVDKIQSSKDGDETCTRLAESSLFVCNKWDLVNETQKEEVKKYFPRKLSDCWQNANLYHQIVYFSTTQAIKVQKYGGVTTELNDLLESIEKVVLRIINTTLYNHWEWLDSVLRHIYYVTDELNIKVVSNIQKKRDRIHSIKKRIESGVDKVKDVRSEVNELLNDETQTLREKMSDFISSPEFSMTFHTWTNLSLQREENTWENMKIKLKKAVRHRFEKMLANWEQDNQIYSKIHRRLADEFLERLNITNGELNHVEEKFNPVEEKVVEDYGQMSALESITMRFDVIQRRKFNNYRADPRGYLEKRSKKFMTALTEDDVYIYAQRQMEKTAALLSKFTREIPTLMENDKKELPELEKKARTDEIVSKKYTLIIEKSADLRANVIPPLGIEVCPATIEESNIEWQNDENSCLGEGKFSLVYNGKLRNYGERDAIPVAVKVFKQPFDEFNSKIYLSKERVIRHLKHKNVIKFFGAARVNVSSTSNDRNLFFVLELCKDNLRNFIHKDSSNVPALSWYTNQAIDKFLQWAKEIADGLNYIHQKELVHRHLKLENILVNRHGTPVIADIGIAGQFNETEKSVYLAPEVLSDPMKRTKEADIYSYGIILWEMWYGIEAFKELLPLDATFQEKIENGHRPKIDNTINIPELHTVIKRSWATEITVRYSAEECYEMFQKILEKRIDITDIRFV